MRIAVVGSGAMGSLFGALLREAGAEVWLVDTWTEHVQVISNNGLEIEREGETRRVKLLATTKIREIDGADLIIIFTKSTQTASAAQAAAGLARPNSLVLTLQNGMGNAEIISKVFDSENVLAGTTSHGATLIGPGQIRHAGVGLTRIGLWAGGDSASIRDIAAFFTKAGIETEVVGDVQSIIWNKLIVNIGINAITALTGISNGQLLDLPITKKLCRAAIDEAVAVARGEGINIKNDAVDHVFQVAQATASNRSSMGQDVDQKRETEIETINGFIVRRARDLGLDASVNFALTALIETQQAHY